MELERGDLDSLPPFTFIRAREADAHWRYLLKVPGKAQLPDWLDDSGARWTNQFPATVIELLWHPQVLPAPAPEMAQVTVLKSVANSHEKQRVAPPRLTPPADYEPENYATDGSRDAELADLRAQVTDLSERLRSKTRLLNGVRSLVDNLSDSAEKLTKIGGPLHSEIRELRMVVQGGDSIRRTARAEEAVEEWLQDPRHSIYDLVSDLSAIVGPSKGAWRK